MTSKTKQGEEAAAGPVLPGLAECQGGVAGSPYIYDAHGGGLYFAHPTAVIDAGAKVGRDSRIWHFCHVMAGARIGARCNIGQNCFVDDGAVVGDDCKLQNNVSVYREVVLEAFVFCGPSCVFTNVVNPRSEINRRGEYKRTFVRRGATIGGNATIVCGSPLGRYCFVGAGAVVTCDVPDYALVLGAPARQVGWMSRHGQRLRFTGGAAKCPQSGWTYQLVGGRAGPPKEWGQVECVDWPEDKPLPP